MYDDPFHDVSDPLNDSLDMDAGDAGEDPGWDGDSHDQALDHDGDGGEDHGHDHDHGHGHDDDHDHDHENDHDDGHGHDHDHPSATEDHPDHFGSGGWDPPHLENYLHHIDRITLVGEEANPDWPTQQGPQDCAFTAEVGVLQALGHHVSEADARELALSEGWLTEHGTSPEHMGHLLEAFGVEVDVGYERSLSDLLDALKNGHKVLVGLDGEEIWHPVHGGGGAPLELPNHAHVVCVSGCTVDDAGHTWMEINDPAAVAKPGHPVDVNDFLNAWADFGNFAVITRN